MDGPVIVAGCAGTLACGNRVRLNVVVNTEAHVIVDVVLQRMGAGSACSAGPPLRALIAGRSIVSALRLSQREIAEALAGTVRETSHCAVFVHEALRASVAAYLGQSATEERHDGAVTCRCYTIREGLIRRAVHRNSLTNLAQVTHYTKAGAGCGQCAGAVEHVLHTMNAESPQDALLGLLEARPSPS
jgi:NifU-like protein